jgi:hypothetical protein
MCYEMIRYLIKQAEKDYGRASDSHKKKSAVLGAFAFLIVHEFGHALIDLFSLPAAGREEDVADQLALASILEEQTPDVAAVALGGALWLFRKGDESEFSEEAFRNEHAISKQRYYNIMCWAYGKDSSRYGVFKDELQGRASRCKDEYQKSLIFIKSVWQPRVTQGSVGGGAPSSQPLTASSPTFQVTVNQVYNHPSDPMLKFGYDGEQVFVTHDRVHFPLAMLQLSSFPDGQWIPLQSIDQRQLPIMVQRRGHNLMARWTQ